MLYLISFIVTVSQRLILSFKPSYPVHLLKGINSILKFCLGISTLLSLNSISAKEVSLLTVTTSPSSNLLYYSSLNQFGCPSMFSFPLFPFPGGNLFWLTE